MKKLGCPVRFKICPSGTVGIHFLFAAPMNGYIPITASQGTFLLDGPLVLVSQGLQSFPCEQVDLVIPSVPGLIGANIFMQGGLRNIGPIGPPVLTNSICFKILSGTVPCQLPSC